MKAFGCKVYVLNKAPGKGKFQPRGIQGVFIGYSAESKVYRVWIPAERKVKTVRDISFLEETVSLNPDSSID